MGAERDEPGARPGGGRAGQSTFEPREGALVGDKYRLERPLAGGGMGSVWVARHVKLDAKVAIKFIARELLGTPSALARFEREAKASAKLSSPHVVKVHDFGVEDGMPFMVMELLLGEDLGTRFDRVGRLSVGEAADVAIAVGKALRAAHEVGLVHRDLKPRNVFLATQGGETVIKLLDFGIARETKTQLVDDRTSSGLVLGSPYHMAPEQAQGLEVDHRADLWALGVVLFRALTGRRPFEGESVTLVLFAICTKRHPDPTTVLPELPRTLDDFFARSLAKNPEGRFDSATDMVASFLDALGRPRAKEDDSSGSRAHGPASGALRPADESASAKTPAGGTGATGDLRGRVDATKSRVAPVPGPEPDGASGSGSDQGAPASKDLSGSRALSAVSTGVVPIQVVSPFTRRTLIAAAVVAIGVGTLLAVRGWAPADPVSSAASVDPTRPEAIPSASSPSTTNAGSARPVVAPSTAPTASSDPAVEPLAPAAPSAVAPAPSASPVPPRGVSRPATTPPTTGRPVAPSKINPFTGLPVGP